MRRALIAAIVLLPIVSLPAAASDTASPDPSPLPVPVQCWVGSQEVGVAAEKVSAESGALVITYKDAVQTTTLPCIARFAVTTDPAVRPPTPVVCLDHSGAKIYSGEAVNSGFVNGVLWWYEENFSRGYILVFATAQCWIGDDVKALEGAAG